MKRQILKSASHYRAVRVGFPCAIAHLKLLYLFPWLFVPEVLLKLTEISIHIQQRWTVEKKPKWFWNNWARRHRRKLLPSWQHLSLSGIFPSVWPGFGLFCTWSSSSPSGRNCVLATASQEYLSFGSLLMQVLGMNYLTIFLEVAQCTDKSVSSWRERERAKGLSFKTWSVWGLAADSVSIPGTT